MNRGDGLVQRRRVANSAGGNGGLGQDGSNNDLGAGLGNDRLSGQGCTDGDCSSSQKDLNCNPTVDEDSDKETRLTLMEEVLLLGLKDKEVCLRRRARDRFAIAVGRRDRRDLREADLEAVARFFRLEKKC